MLATMLPKMGICIGEVGDCTQTKKADEPLQLAGPDFLERRSHQPEDGAGRTVVVSPIHE